jgi:uncharacterized membrane protein
MLFGAGIWLVAQVYHIDEHFPTAFLVWGLGALALAWAMPSVAQGILAAILLAVWNGTEAAGFDAPRLAGPLLMLAALAPLAWHLRSRVLLAVVIPAFVVAQLMGLAYYHNGIVTVFAVLFVVAALLTALGHLLRHERHFPGAAAVCTFYGWVGYAPMLLVLTFPDACRELFGHDRHMADTPGLYWIVVTLLALALWAVAGWAAFRRRHGEPLSADLVLIPLTVLYALAVPFCGLDGWHGDWTVAGPFNLALLALAAARMARGCRLGLVGPTVTGSILLAVLVFARYADLFESLLARGFVFILVGAVIFGEGLLFAHARKRRAAEERP